MSPVSEQLWVKQFGCKFSHGRHIAFGGKCCGTTAPRFNFLSGRFGPEGVSYLADWDARDKSFDNGEPGFLISNMATGIISSKARLKSWSQNEN